MVHRYDKRSTDARGNTIFVADAMLPGRHAASVFSSADLLAALHRLRAEGTTTNADLARLLNLPSSRISEIFDGKRKVTIDEAKLIVERFAIVAPDAERHASIMRVGRAFGQPEAGHGSTQPEQPRSRSADGGETAAVTRLDLSYAMGSGTELDESYVDGEPFEFDIGFLRGLTITPPERLRIVDGIGDSMQPTLHDHDLLFVDINQRELNAQDRIWAISLFGAGAVKRLKVVGNDRVLVVSDNKEVGDQEVARSDIRIHGRVVGSIKRH
jgi:hypothetical protein